MPILWRFLLEQYFKVLVLAAISFIAVLLTTRLDEIAHFATLGAEGIYVLWFTLYQIPYILPIAIPISCLISVIILLQRLSTTHELTALRASGLSIRQILTPILIAAAWLSLGSFYLISEVATDSHLATGILKTELRSMNPMLLMNNKYLMKMKGFYFDTLGSSRAGESAQHVIIAMPNKNNTRINLMLAKGLEADTDLFTGKGVTLLSSLGNLDRGKSDHLMIENIGEAKTTLRDFSQMIEKKVWTVNNDHLKMPALMIRLRDDREAFDDAVAQERPTSEQKQLKRTINRDLSEIFRRVSLALAVFTFTLMGAAFGVTISRQKSNKGMIYTICLATLFLVTYFMAKGIDHVLSVPIILYFAPHVLIVALSVWALQRASKGVEA